MLLFFPAPELPDGTASGLDKLSATDAADDGFLLVEQTSCCDGLSASSAGLVLEL